MTDLITRARKEWLEVHKSPEDAPDGEAWHYTLPCPTAVVAALLDVMRIIEWAESCPDCRVLQVYEHGVGPYKHGAGCKVAVAIDEIEKALEGK